MIKNRLDSCCEVKVKMIFEFLLELRLSKKVMKSDSSTLAFTVKQSKNDVLFISLNCDCQKSLRWSLKVMPKLHMKVPSNSLVCDLIFLTTGLNWNSTDYCNRNPSNSSCGFLASPKLFVAFIGESLFILFQNAVKD